MTHEEDLEEQLSNEICKAIDYEVLEDILVRHNGWTRLKCHPRHDFDSVELWVKDNVTGHYHNYALSWAFENSQDAMLFKLMWA